MAEIKGYWRSILTLLALVGLIALPQALESASSWVKDWKGYGLCSYAVLLTFLIVERDLKTFVEAIGKLRTPPSRIDELRNAILRACKQTSQPYLDLLQEILLKQKEEWWCKEHISSNYHLVAHTLNTEVSKIRNTLSKIKKIEEGHMPTDEDLDEIITEIIGNFEKIKISIYARDIAAQNSVELRHFSDNAARLQELFFAAIEQIEALLENFRSLLPRSSSTFNGLSHTRRIVLGQFGPSNAP